ncbi:GNAT family N-acetyltransferase [Vibrio sp. SS-MA-C1-2]|uniref:GNAT family N-acetyltransferase n=1 Tax=Vibrio sp. SS-MA-C1-2 TaxID=2908646 RepID=UPI001F31CF1E|nr:GNAT family N-acetyltransferase [Vibrio sp. SS-MA-C1-2]UJF17368.1 GNAT family N-acetyltransferase [Vibrio sp. SS-MA-C1-2]
MNSRIIEIVAEHDQDICDVIKKVGIEFGAIGEGFGPSDQEVLNMSQHYKPENRSRYFILFINGRIVGGGGVASFNQSETICELKKLFLLPEARGLGFGRKISELAINAAQDFGYQRCYLDTLSNMERAIALYESIGFSLLTEPLSGTLHNGCDVAMIKDL